MGASFSQAAFTREWERAFTVQPEQAVRIDVRGSGSVTIEAGESDTTLSFAVQLLSNAASNADAEAVFERLEFLFEEEGDTVELIVRSKADNKGWRLWGSAKWPQVSIMVICPPRFSASVDTKSGSIEVEGVSGELSFDTGSGSVQVRHASGQLAVDTGSGSVDILDFSGNVDADTGSGHIHARDVVGQFSADTGSGSVLLSGAIDGFEIDTGSGRVSVDSSTPLANSSSVDTGSGSISASFPQDTPLRLNLKTGSGSFAIDTPNLTAIQSSKHAFKAQTHPEAPELILHTGSGDIRVQHPIP